MDNILAYDDGGDNPYNEGANGSSRSRSKSRDRNKSIQPQQKKADIIAHGYESKGRNQAKSQWKRVARQDVLNQRSSIDQSILILENKDVVSPTKERRARDRTPEKRHFEDQYDSLEELNTEKQAQPNKKLAQYLQKNIKAAQQCQYGQRLQNLSPGKITKFQNKVKESSKLLISSQKYSSKSKGDRKRQDSPVKQGSKLQFQTYAQAKLENDQYVSNKNQKKKQSYKKEV